MKAIAIDDDPMALAIIENYCREIEHIELEKTFDDPKAGLKHLNKFPVDLIFLDIEMPGLTGLELFQKLKQDVMVIFITSRPEYAVEGFNLMAVDYLLKPFQFERFNQAVKRASEFLNFKTNKKSDSDAQYLYIRADFSLVKIAIEDILYIEALDDYLKIYIQDQKTLVARMTMKGMMEKLPKNKFIRVHRSFIVSMSRMQAVRSKSVLIDRIEIPLGGNFADEVMAAFQSR